MRRKIVGWVLALVLVITPSNILAAGWPMERFDARNSGQGAALGSDTAQERWATSLGVLNPTTPVVDSLGRVFVGAGTSIYSFRHDGWQMWHVTADGSATVTSAPALSAQEDSIYIGVDTGGGEHQAAVQAYDTATGDHRWTFSAAGKAVKGITTAGDKIIFTTQGTGSYPGGHVYAVQDNRQDAQLLWEFPASGYPSVLSSESLPAVSPDGNRVYVAVNHVDNQGYVYALDINDGQLLGEFPGPIGSIQTHPVVNADGTKLYVTDSNGYVYAYNTGDFTLAWSHDLGYAASSVAAHPSGRLAVVEILDTKQLYLLRDDGESAAIDWQQPVANTAYMLFPTSSPLTDRSGKIYVGTPEGVYLFDAQGNKLWQYPVAGKITVSMALGPDGTVYYVTSNGQVGAINLPLDQDVQSPELTLSPLSTGDYVYGRQEIRIDASDTGTGIWQVEWKQDDGPWQAASYDDGAGAWVAQWDVPAGDADGTAYILSYSVTDWAFNRAERSLEITKDGSPPQVELTHPVGGLVTLAPGEKVTVSGSASDPVSGVREAVLYYQQQGRLAEITTFTNLAGEAPFKFQTEWEPPGEGSYRLVVVSEDNALPAGNRGEVQVELQINIEVPDTSPPVSTITSPADGTLVAGGTVTVAGSAYDDSGLARVEVGLAVNGGPVEWYPVEGTSTWQYVYHISPALNHGDQISFISRAVDAAHNAESGQVIGAERVTNIYLDRQPPVVQFISPLSGRQFRQSTIPLEVYAWDSGAAGQAGSVTKLELYYRQAGSSAWQEIGQVDPDGGRIEWTFPGQGEFEFLAVAADGALLNGIPGGNGSTVTVTGVRYKQETDRDDDNQIRSGGPDHGGTGSEKGGGAVPADMDQDNRKTFTDLAGHWAEDAVLALQSKHLLPGVTGQLFLPDEKVSRAQFTAIMAQLLELEPLSPSPVPFADLQPDRPYYRKVVAALQAGLVDGISPGRFDPEGPITREQAAVLVARALEYSGITVSDGLPENGLPFHDWHRVSSWAVPGVLSAVKARVVRGRPGQILAPHDLLTRAEAAVLVHRCLELLKY